MGISARHGADLPKRVDWALRSGNVSPNEGKLILQQFFLPLVLHHVLCLTPATGEIVRLRPNWLRSRIVVPSHT